ncbi:MAG: cardiolipin synthase [Peptoniphilaceae bacterium]|nr:cardiolipin synthase [Peptoniphilaceae bacterium]MDY6019042.1 cardiolipin synthase [Anaerococcus sp.]
MKFLKNIFSRISIMVIMIILEFILLISLVFWFGVKVSWIENIFRVVGLFIVVSIINNSRHLSADMLWILAILIVPVSGTALYLFLGADLLLSKTFQNIKKSTKDAEKYYIQNPEVLEEMKVIAKDESGQFKYISEYSGYPFYKNTGFTYYPVGDDSFEPMINDLKNAKEFIFLEYFIIEEGFMWNSILDILEEKAKLGLDVRVMYDDMGSMVTLSATYAQKLEEKGIKCIPFNKINPVIGIIMNHRDHRKIMVIDGKVAYTGGINLADEYINKKVRFGHWKDNACRVIGEAVWSYTVMFLTNWNAISDKKDSDYSIFWRSPLTGSPDGYISSYGDTPLDNETTGQDVYISILNQARNYCYIFTPYLIIDTEMENALVLAAKRGVDVRIITPGIPDKKIVWHITRSYYRNLIKDGVKIYEYTPGFMHSKVFLCDDKIGTVGTINLDYRSLYLHFENGTYLYNSKELEKIKIDFEKTIEVSKRIHLEDVRISPIKSMFLGFAKLFAPLL